MSPRVSDLFLRSQSDERLVSLARAGHARAFSTIVERYRPELAALARRLSADGRGEDILQQAFLSAFAALRNGSEVKHLRGWLYQIVRNSSAREQRPLGLPLESTTPAVDSLEDVVQRRALARATLSELAQLPARQRQALVGTALDGRARADLARSMGLSEGAVRQLVHRARTTLRSALTAVTPWPLARWLAAAGAGASTSGGVATKLSLVVVSGSLATGIATVTIDGPGSHGPPARALSGVHARSGHRAAQPAASLGTVVLPASAGARHGSPTASVVTAEVSLRRMLSGGQPNAAVRRMQGGHRGRAGSSGPHNASGRGTRSDHRGTGEGSRQRGGGGGYTTPAGGGRYTGAAGGGRYTPPADGGGFTAPSDGGSYAVPAGGSRYLQTTGGDRYTRTSDGGSYTQGGAGGPYVAAGTDQEATATNQVGFASSVPSERRSSGYGGDSQAWTPSNQFGGGYSSTGAGYP